MPNTLRIGLLRDKKEAELKRIQENARLSEARKLIYLEDFEKALQRHKKWLLDNEMEGIDF